MPTIPQIATSHKLCHLLTFSLLEQLYPRDLVACLLGQDRAWEQRERKLSHLVMVYLLIVWSMMARRSLRAVCDHLLRPLRLRGDELTEATPTSAAFWYRRKRLGVRVFRHLFQAVCHPFAATTTSGAFAFGLRLMGIDGTRFAVADTPANRACFCEQTSSTKSPFPQMLAVFLVEIGTHAIVDAIPAVSHVGESRLVKGLLRSLFEGMLVLMDRGFYSAALIGELRKLGAHMLGRLASKRLLGPARLRSFGSCLVTLTPGQYPELHEDLIVRVITYHLRPQAVALLQQVTPSHSQHGSGTRNPRVGQTHRLVTTLLDPQLYPALELCLLYHERWEVELVIDEIKEHQRIAELPLSSKHPMGVFQEFYALLLAHYAVRVLMGKAAQQAHVDPDRISFTLALEVAQDALSIAALLNPAQHAGLFTQSVNDLTRPDWFVPRRRLRFNARVIKRSRSRFQIKRADHVFLSAKAFPWLHDQRYPDFQQLLLI